MTLTALVFVGGAAGTHALSRPTTSGEGAANAVAPAPQPEEPPPSRTNVVAPPTPASTEARPARVAAVDVTQLPNVPESAAAAQRTGQRPAAPHDSTGSTFAASVPSPAAPASSASGSSDLHLEIIALDGVHRAIETGSPREALARLDDYGKRFPTGKLREEATVLRIEALHAGGDRQAAERLAERLLRDSPNTPYVARVRAALVQSPRE